MKKKTLFRKGFTLIELLVVIAVISLLASIVVASLNTSRSKGKDVAAKENIINLRSISELYYLENGNSYSGFCQSNDARSALSTATSTTGLDGDCDVAADNQSWAAEVDLILEDHFCIDTRSSGKVTTDKADDATTCP